MAVDIDSEIPASLAPMFDAHVRFEVDRLTGASLDEGIRREVAIAFEVLGGLTVGDLGSAGHLAGIAQGMLSMPITPASRAAVVDAVLVGHGALVQGADAAATLEDLLPKEEYERLVSLVIGMDAIRREAMEQMTSSVVYSRLVAHVMVFGIKAYLTTENVLAKKIPGVQSLAKLGQKGLNAAMPGLDDQLVSFVSANIKDVVGESQRYLDHLLDEPLLRTVADEIRAVNGPRTVASLAALVTASQVEQAVSLGLDIVEVARQTTLFDQVLAKVIADGASRNTDRTIASLLADSGISAAFVAAQLVEVLRPVLSSPSSNAAIEAGVRARLAPFYLSYSRDGSKDAAAR